MASSKVTFCSLLALVGWAHREPPKVPCLYLVNKGLSPCSRQINQTNCQSASPFFPILLDLLSGLPEEDYTLSEVVDELARLFLCRNHLPHVEQAVVQWLGELGRKRMANHVLRKLQEFYDAGTGDESEGEVLGHEESEQEESEQEEFEQEESEEEESEEEISDEEISEEEDEEDDEFEEDCDNQSLEEGFSGLSLQSSIFTSCSKNTLSQVQVAKKVALLAKQRLGKNSRNTGYIYLFSSTFPGMVKIGYSRIHPEEQRLPNHKACYGEIQKILEVKTLYPYRVEQFVLTELSAVHCKLREECHKCKTHHQEWLEIDRERLERTVRKWIAFVDTLPYNRQWFLRKKAVLPPPFNRDGSYGGSGGASQSTPTKRARHASPLSKITDVSIRCVVSDEDESDEESDESGDDRAVYSLTEQFRQIRVSKGGPKAGR